MKITKPHMLIHNDPDRALRQMVVDMKYHVIRHYPLTALRQSLLKMLDEVDAFSYTGSTSR